LWHVTAEGAYQIEASGGPDCSHIAGRNLGRNNRMGCGVGASQPCPSTGASAYSPTAGSSSSTAGYAATVTSDKPDVIIAIPKADTGDGQRYRYLSLGQVLKRIGKAKHHKSKHDEDKD